MVAGKAAVGLAAAGLAITALGVFVFTLDAGSCPRLTSGPGEPGCGHVFPGTDVSIYRTGSLLVFSGLSLIVTGGFVGAYAWFLEKPRKEP